MTQRRNPGNCEVEDLWYKKDKTPSSRHGVGKRWRVRWVDYDGHQKTRSFDRQQDAKSYKKQIIASIATGDYIDRSKGQVTVADVYTRWEPTQVHVKPKTRYDRISPWNVDVKPRWGEREVGSIQKSEVSEWIGELHAAGKSPSKIAQVLEVLRLVLGFAVDDGLIKTNPARGVKTPRKTEQRKFYLTVPQVETIAKGCGDHATMIRVLAYTGLRWGECAALRVEDVDLEKRHLWVRHNDSRPGGKLVETTPKSHEQRWVPYPDFIHNELKEAMQGKLADDRVFQSLEGKPLDPANFSYRVYRPLIKALNKEQGYPLITIHDLRHTAASLAVSSGANIKSLQRMLGHKSAALTLDTYTDLFEEDLSDVALKMDALIQSSLKCTESVPGNE